MLPPTLPSGKWVWNISAVLTKLFARKNREISCNNKNTYIFDTIHFKTHGELSLVNILPSPKHQTKPDVSVEKICREMMSLASEEGRCRIYPLHRRNPPLRGLEDTQETSSSSDSGRGCKENHQSVRSCSTEGRKFDVSLSLYQPF